jgi:hypothetical protein
MSNAMYNLPRHRNQFTFLGITAARPYNLRFAALHSA